VESFLHFPHLTITYFPQDGQLNSTEFGTIEMSALQEIHIFFSIEISNIITFIIVLLFKRLMKQAIVVRKDLKLSKGKLAAQVAHAAVTLALETKSKKRSWFHRWILEGQKKIVLKVENLNELRKIKRKADEYKIPNVMIKDAGLTEVPPGTITCLGLGPAPDDEMDRLVGKLKLL